MGTQLSQARQVVYDKPYQRTPHGYGEPNADSGASPKLAAHHFMPSIAEMIDGMLESAEEVHGSLQVARTRLHVMDDYTLGRVRDVHGTQLDDLWLYEEQLSRWQKATHTPGGRHAKSALKSLYALSNCFNGFSRTEKMDKG
jgi:hypothetical protein